MTPSGRSEAFRLGVALAAVAVVTLVFNRWLHVANAATVSIAYLMVVLLVAATSRLRVAVSTSIASMLCLNFFFLPPVGAFTIHETENWVALFAFLTVSLVASHLSAVAQARTHEAEARRDELARLFDERAQLLEERKAAELTRQSERLKTALLASLGHDLRTPLTAIGVAASNIRDAALPLDDRIEQSDLILSEVERLTRLFQNLLEMARIDAGAVATDSRRTHPSEIVAAARTQVDYALRRHTVDVRIDPDVPVRLDPRLTATAVAHLLENAAQYSPAGSTIQVTAGVWDDSLTIAVRDHGPGISATDLPRLFDRFYRGAAATSRTPGTGMGLWIVRGLLALENGRVSVENCADGGAQFTIAVPVS